MSESAASENDLPQKAFSIRLFRGEVRLPITYWVFGVVGNVVLNSIIDAFSNPPVPVALALAGVAILYAVFISIAIWRSANKYHGLPIWRVLAKIAVILGVLGFIAKRLNY